MLIIKWLHVMVLPPKSELMFFFRLKHGTFITYADGKDKRVQFRLQKIKRMLPEKADPYSEEDLQANFKRIYEEAKGIFIN